jgi:hypothetical protein
VALFAVFVASLACPAAKAWLIVRMIAVAWTLFALAAIMAAMSIEQSFSPFSQLQARYHPPLMSAILGAIMILLIRFQLPDGLWIQPTNIFILISLCAAQTADVAATRRWNAYVADLQFRLANWQGLIPWETTLHTADERADFNWQLMKIGWVVPYTCIVYSQRGRKRHH